MNTHIKKEYNEIQTETYSHDLANSVLEKIHQNKIHPITRKYFAIREVCLWIPGIFVTLLGGFAFGGIIFNSLHSSMSYREFIEPQPLPFLIRELPVIWIIAFLLFSLVIIKAFRQTKSGYKYSAPVILGVSVLASFVVGIVLVQVDEHYENPLLRFPTEYTQRSIWFNPADGRLVGMISRTGDEHFVLTDSNQKVWNLNMTEIPNISEFVLMDPSVRLIGKTQDEDTFLVCIVLPGKIEKKNKSMGPLPMIHALPIPTFVECNPILQEIREHHRERKNKLHP